MAVQTHLHQFEGEEVSAFVVKEEVSSLEEVVVSDLVVEVEGVSSQEEQSELEKVSWESVS